MSLKAVSYTDVRGHIYAAIPHRVGSSSSLLGKVFPLLAQGAIPRSSPSWWKNLSKKGSKGPSISTVYASVRAIASTVSILSFGHEALLTDGHWLPI
jgi:hypothetical protein